MNTRIRSVVAAASVAALGLLAACSDDEKAVEATTTAAPAGTEAPATTAKAKAHWTYEGEEGPENWGKLDPAYVTCADGSAQTPIDIAAPTEEDLANPVIAYAAGAAKVLNNGHTVQLQAAEGSKLVLDGVDWPLLQIHFHTPSEHTINGKSFAGEVHFVHKNAEGALAVLGMMIAEGAADNAAWKPYIDVLGTAEEAEGVTTSVDWAAMLPSNLQTFRYAGSLTTPPCTEGVSWLLLQTPVELSAAQIDAFEAAYSGNARPVQPINGREVKADNSAEK